MALGEAVEPDYRALPRATYTDPEAAFVGVTLERGARGRARRVRAGRRLRRRARRGYGVEADVRPRDDRRRPRPRDSWSGRRWPARTRRRRSTSACSPSRPDVPVDVLAETIHAFPSTSRILNGLFADALPRAGPAGQRRRRDARSSARRRPRRPSGPALGRAVDERPAGLDRLVEGRGGDAPPRPRAGPTISRPRSVSRADTRRVDAGCPERPVERRAPARGRTAASRPASAGPRGGRPGRCPGHGSNGSTGASVPNAMTAPVRARRRPRVAARLGAVAPQRAAPSPRPTRGGPAGRWPRCPPRRTAAESSGWSSWTCSMRGISGRRAAVGVEDVERGPDRRVADGVDLRRDPAGRRPRRRGPRARPGRSSRRRGAGPAASGRSGFGLDVLEQARGPRPQRAVGEALLPADPGAARPGPRRGRRRSGGPARCAASSCVVAHAGVDAGPAVAGVGQAGVGRERVGQVRVRRERPPGRGRRRRRAPTSSPPERLDASAEVVRGRRRDVDRDEPGRGLVEHALGRPVGRRAGRRRRADPSVAPTRRRSASAAWLAQQRVVVVRPERDPPAGRDRSRSSAVGQPPQRSRVPAVPLEPGVRVRPGAAWAAPTAASPSVEGRGARSGRPGAARQRRLGEVEVGVGQAGDRDLVRLEARCAG